MIEALNHIGATIDWTRTEVLCQDDASPDYDLTKLVGPPFKVERNSENMGFIRNVNQAAKRAKGDYLCLFNQDCKPLMVGWADIMLSLFMGNPKIGIVGPKLLFPDGSIQSCGGLFDGGRGPFHRYLGWKNADDRRVNTTEKVGWITGACLMISRADFWKCGGLDEIHYQDGYFEDVSLCMQVRHELNKQVWYCAEAVIEHSVGSTGGSRFFLHNSLAFHRLWDDKIVPDTDNVYVNY